MKKSKKKEITPVSFRIYTPLYEKIKWYAENQRRSVNRQVELIFEEFVEKNHIEIKKELTTEENEFSNSFHVEENQTNFIKKTMSAMNLTMKNFNIEDLPIYFSQYGLTHTQFAKILNKQPETVRRWYVKGKQPHPANVGLMINALRDLESGKINPDDYK